jgi:hypothetical protein
VRWHEPPTSALRAAVSPPEQWLTERALRYDPGAALVVNDGPAPHEHLPRESAWYAEALLARGRPDDITKARKILVAVLSAQERRASSRWYGLWPVSVEVPLNDSRSPDINWAEFLSTALFNVLVYDALLPPSLVDSLDAANMRTVAFLRGRELGPTFHNMHALQTGVFLRAAARYDWPMARIGATARIATVDTLLSRRRTRDEYNSPTYSWLALEALGRARPAAARLGVPASTLLATGMNVLCTDLRRHYLPDMGEIAGPHSRAYGAMLSGWLQRDVERLLTDTVTGCPGPGGVSRFSRVLVDTFIPVRPGTVTEPIYLGGRLRVVGTTLVERDLAIGSVSVGGFWAQHQPLIAYVGDASKHGYLRLRVLRDGVDFAGAQWFAAQRPGAALGAVLFATDGGTDHPQHPFDPRALPLREIRVRFEFGGALRPDSLPLPGKRGITTVRLGTHHFVLGVSFASVGALKSHWERADGVGETHLDLVLTSDAATLPLLVVPEAAIVVVVGSDGAVASPAPVVDRLGDGTLGATWGSLSLRVPVRPTTLDSLHRAMAAFRPVP